MYPAAHDCDDVTGMYLDSHAHLERQHYGSDLEAVLDRAQATGMAIILAVGNGSPENDGHQQALQLARERSFILASLGVHPHEAAQSSDHFLDLLEGLAREEARVVAWGEIGLDYHYDFSPRSIQRPVFQNQLERGRRLGLPVVVHSREAEEDTLDLLRPWACDSPWGVLHCFSGSREFAWKGLDMGMFLSFSGILTFKKAQALRDIARSIPIDRLLVESDCPYLAPVPWRGRRNEPAWVKPTTDLLAEIRGISVREMQFQLLDNFSRLFNVNIASLE